uniref:CIMAP1 family member D n=1 Tax=Oncorhynchus mykiss TaxID=8022 RepID=A0A8C7SAU2_ONCMY
CVRGQELGIMLSLTVAFISHAFTKPTSPAYSFHDRISNNCEYYRGHKRDPKDGNTAYSTLGKPFPPAGLFHTPGLAAYSPENAPPCNIQRRPPSYTMCCHTRYCSSNSAPKKHRLPALMGPQVPTKLARGSSEDMSKTPGPGRYNSTDPSVYLPRQPAFSMLAFPGTRNPEKVIVHKPRAPAFSLGIRHRVCHPTGGQCS